MFSRLLRFLLQSVTVTLLCTTASAAGDRIVVGQAIDLSGPDSAIGRDYVAGIKTYFDSVNASGGIGGKRIEYVVRDDQGQPALTTRLATELIEHDHADYLFGGVGDNNVQAVLESGAFRRSGQVLFAPLASGDAPAEGRVVFWRPGYAQELRHIFSHFSRLGVHQVGIAYQDTPSNHPAYRGLSQVAREMGIAIAGTVRIGAKDAAIDQEAGRLAASRPGFVLILGDTIGAAQFLKAYRKHDARTFIAGTSLINLTTLRELAGPTAVEWTVFSQVVPNPAAGTSLLQIEHLNMMRKYRDEAVSSMTLEGFAAAKALTSAIRQYGRGSRGALREFMAQSGDIDLGGFRVAASQSGTRLSAYLDIALFRKGGGLMF